MSDKNTYILYNIKTVFVKIFLLKAYFYDLKFRNIIQVLDLEKNKKLVES